MASRAEIRASCFLMASQRDVSSYSEVQAIDENRVHVAIAITDDNLMSLYIVSDSVVYVQVKGTGLHAYLKRAAVPVRDRCSDLFAGSA